MDISPQALRSMVEEVDEAHHDGMRDLSNQIGELHFGEGAKVMGATRRNLLRNAAMGGAALTIGSAVLPYDRLFAGMASAADALTDADIAGYAGGVELAAVAAYKAAISSGKVTDKAVGAAATVFMGHHQDHANAFNKAAGDKAQKVPNKTILAAVGGQIGKAVDQKAILEIAFSVENAAAATYLFAIGALKDPGALALTASILPVEAQHAVILGTVLKKTTLELFPDKGKSFEVQTGALDPASNPA